MKVTAAVTAVVLPQIGTNSLRSITAEFPSGSLWLAQSLLELSQQFLKRETVLKVVSGSL